MDFKTLLNYRSLRALLKNATLDDLKKILENLEELKAEIELQEEQKKAEQAQLEAKFKSVISNINELGLTVEEFNAYTAGAATAKGPRKTRAPMKPKYRYTALDGSVNEWTGQGKMPKIFKQLLEAENRDKEYYRIKE